MRGGSASSADTAVRRRDAGRRTASSASARAVRHATVGARAAPAHARRGATDAGARARRRTTADAGHAHARRMDPTGVGRARRRAGARRRGRPAAAARARRAARATDAQVAARRRRVRVGRARLRPVRVGRGRLGDPAGRRGRREVLLGECDAAPARRAGMSRCICVGGATRGRGRAPRCHGIRGRLSSRPRVHRMQGMVLMAVMVFLTGAMAIRMETETARGETWGRRRMVGLGLCRLCGRLRSLLPRTLTEVCFGTGLMRFSLSLLSSKSIVCFGVDVPHASSSVMGL